MELEKPSEKYKKSFLEAVLEYEHDPESKKYTIAAQLANFNKKDFSNYIKTKLDHSQGINLPQGYVSASEYWLIDGNEFIGKVSIRHQLTDSLLKVGGHIGYTIRPSRRKMGYGTKMLQLALVKAKELGIDKVLITCDKDNIGSRKIIENNAGILENEVPQGEGESPKLRYWINLG